MIFVPLARSRAEALRRLGREDTALHGYAATPALMRSHGFDAKADEDANFAAQTYAMVAGLSRRDEGERGRVVVAVDAPNAALDDHDDGDGAIEVTGLEWRWAQAVFSDGAEVSDEVDVAVEAAAEAAGGRPLAEAIEAGEVDALIQDHDLLWHLPDEAW